MFMLFFGGGGTSELPATPSGAGGVTVIQAATLRTIQAQENDTIKTQTNRTIES